MEPGEELDESVQSRSEGADDTFSRQEPEDFKMVECDADGASPAEDGGDENAGEVKKTAAARYPTVAAPGQRAFIMSDVADFVAKYPGFGPDELDELENNPQFRRFCGTRFGREPLAALYGDYLSVVGSAGAAAVSRAAKKTARSTGGGTTGGDALTSAQREVLKRWNEEHPEMKMTAKEFLRR